MFYFHSGFVWKTNTPPDKGNTTLLRYGTSTTFKVNGTSQRKIMLKSNSEEAVIFSKKKAASFKQCLNS